MMVKPHRIYTLTHLPIITTWPESCASATHEEPGLNIDCVVKADVPKTWLQTAACCWDMLLRYDSGSTRNSEVPLYIVSPSPNAWTHYKILQVSSGPPPSRMPAPGQVPRKNPHNLRLTSYNPRFGGPSSDFQLRLLRHPPPKTSPQPKDPQ